MHLVYDKDTTTERLSGVIRTLDAGVVNPYLTKEMLFVQFWWRIGNWNGRFFVHVFFK